MLRRSNTQKHIFKWRPKLNFLPFYLLSVVCFKDRDSYFEIPLPQPISFQLYITQTGSDVMKTNRLHALTARTKQTVLSTLTAAMLKAVGQALFSTGLQNPKFTAEEKQEQDYEIRTYHATNWVSTTLSGMQWDAAMNAGFRRLFNYIQGNNNNKVKVEMTAPVSCRVDPGAGPACESQFTVSFYIPEEHQDNPPEPSDPEVFVEHRKEFTAYVRTYGGFSNEKMKREELLKLLESLQRDGVQYVDKPFYAAGYDSPFKLTNRRNEVWVLKQEPV